jgi:hypothetical protein
MIEKVFELSDRQFLGRDELGDIAWFALKNFKDCFRSLVADHGNKIQITRF